MQAAALAPLFEAARSGDIEALARLLEQTQPDLRRYAQRNCLISDVDDAVQETLWILARHVARVRSALALSRWLFRVMRRECRRLARKTLALDLWDETRTDQIMARLPPAHLRLEVARAIESLPEHYRQVLVLRDFEERTIGELAEQLHISPANAKSRLHRARELVREYLAAEGVREPSALGSTS